MLVTSSGDHLSERTESEYCAADAQGLGLVAHGSVVFSTTQPKSQVSAANWLYR